MMTRRKPNHIWLNEPYIAWLLDQIWAEFKPNQTHKYMGLFQILWNREFVWTVPNDGNRLADGLELRYLFLIDEDVVLGRRPPSDEEIAEFRGQACRMLEVIVALARRLDWNVSNGVGWWAWKLIENLGLEMYKDPLGPRLEQTVNDTVDALIFRTYDWKGDGGFFPLERPKDNQTRVEIWYQMAAYLEENYPI